MGWLKQGYAKAGSRWHWRPYSPVDEAEHVLFERLVAGLLAEHRMQETKHHVRTRARMLRAFEQAVRQRRGSDRPDDERG